VHTLLICILACLPALTHTPSVRGDSPMEAAVAVDAPMYDDPRLIGPDMRVEFNPRLRTLWLAALDRHEIDLRLQAADAIGQAHARGYADMGDLAPLLAAKLKDDKHPLVRLALAQALIRLDASNQADALFEANQLGDRDMVLLTDPALARWRHPRMPEVWWSRAADEAAPHAIRRSAIESLGETPSFNWPANALVEDRKLPMTLRLIAAEAVGKHDIEHRWVVELAGQLQRGDVSDRLVGVTLLRARRKDMPLDTLTAYAVDAQSAVAVRAIELLEHTAPGAVLTLNPSPLQRDDANVRYAAARCLFAHNDAAGIAPLATLLDDRDPRTRRFARYALLQFDADPTKRDAVRAEGMRMLTSSNWRGMEQAGLLLGKLDHEPAADRLLELLTHERPETRVAAAVALRWLAIESVLPAMLAHAGSLADADPTSLSIEQNVANANQSTELFQAFGVLGYRDAEPLMRRYIPKASPYSSVARSAAIWALGKLHAGKPEPSLVNAFQGRLGDVNPMNPEATDVRSASAVALGRMKAPGARTVLSRFLKEENASAEIGGACKWALEHITGQTLPPLDTLVDRPSDWFIRPVD
jgi:HEAT repeat protein